jgi:hypothetical protein
MEREPRHGEWMMPLLSDFLSVSGEALRILDDPDVTDRWLLIRRLAEYEIRRGPADEIGDQVFQMAAEKLREQDDEDGARAMDAIAATGDILKNTDLDWKHRYDARPVTTADRASSDLLVKGLIWPEDSGGETGIDGATYGAASIARDQGDPLPVVLTITHSGALEIVSGFGSTADRDAWLADRAIGRAAPADGLPTGPPTAMAGTVTGPDCRTQHEERILAWLLQGGAVGEDIRSLEPHAFSTYSRSEIYLAWRSVADAMGGDGLALGEARHELARRLLRAPAWAGQAVGWPFGHHALAYFDRLAVTPVTRDQGAVAARGLILDATPAIERAGRPMGAGSQAPVVHGVPASGPKRRPSQAEATDGPAYGQTPRA